MKTPARLFVENFKLFVILILLSSTAHLVSSTEPNERRSTSSTSNVRQQQNTENLPGLTTERPEIRKLAINDSREEGEDLKDSPSRMSITTTRANNKNIGQEAEQQTASPSVTSVHQVWTSSSSGSLDELSPEIISKLRSDVPFLAAYALRPRLVGALPTSGGQSSGLVAAAEQTYTSTQLQPPSADSSPPRKGDNYALQIGASSPQKSTQSLVPKLGDFSEFNVETSSTSKSEHHHKRKTSLKRRTNDDELSLKKKRVLATASQLMNKRRASGDRFANRSSKTSTSRRQQRQRSPKRRSSKGKRTKEEGALMRSQARTGRLRYKLNRGNLQHHMNIIRHGRYYQEQSMVPSVNRLDGGEKSTSSMSVDMKTIGDKTTMIVSATKGGSKEVGNQDSGVKGGGRGKEPFYSKARPLDKPRIDDSSETDGESVNSLNNNKDDRPITNVEDATNEDRNSVEEDEEGLQEAPLPEPKRVGEDDVEEEGDTVTVVPKSDGVDDDPEIGGDNNDGADALPASGNGEDRESGEREDGPEMDTRTKRVNRERPNSQGDGLEPGERETSDNNDDDDNGAGQTGVGGGVGATIGGASGVDKNSGSSQSERDDDSRDSDRDGGGGGKAVGRRVDDRVKPGVQFAKDDEDDDDDENRDGGSAGDSDNGGGAKSEFEKGSSESANGGGDQSFGSRKSGSSGNNQGDAADDGVEGGKKHGSRDSTSPAGGKDQEPGDDDVDYRDEMTEAERKKHHEKEEGSGEKKERTNKNCDNDGSYNHHDNHHHGHHDHHDSIKWLEDAIPGEPGNDYPILSRANLTNFNCRDQKYPGFYADVESRCQVFHICQADGRQDSFLCPNGTIFSQISTVCVWWNSFDCEDAPKYYGLNALLYKAPVSSETNGNPPPIGSNLRPLSDGERIKPRDRNNNEQDSSIDSLIRAMRLPSDSVRTGGVGSQLDTEPASMMTYDGTLASGGRKSMKDTIGANDADEATIQRKSTNIADDSSGFVGAASRLRGNAEPRRKRRASVRQAPPKLKSRRVSRNSRRRKLRHGIKPKRRA